MINEDVTGRGMRHLLGRRLTGNKLCVPNQIRLKHKSFFGSRLLKNLGIITESPRSRYSITEYLALPNLKVVAIIRDGNDSISSMVARGKSKLKKAARRWAEAVETIYELKKNYENRILIVAFDDVILKPEETMKRVCQFLGLAFDGQMLDGPRYNPFYPESQLKKEKTHQHKEDKIDLHLECVVPAAWQKYHELLTQVRQR
jgi:Sulfotransferase family